MNIYFNLHPSQASIMEISPWNLREIYEYPYDTLGCKLILSIANLEKTTTILCFTVASFTLVDKINSKIQKGAQK